MKDIQMKDIQLAEIDKEIKNLDLDLLLPEQKLSFFKLAVLALGKAIAIIVSLSLVATFTFGWIIFIAEAPETYRFLGYIWAAITTLGWTTFVILMDSIKS